MTGLPTFQENTTPAAQIKTTDLMEFVAYAMGDPRLSAAARIVLAVIINRHFNRAAMAAWPGLDLLATETNFHRMTVSKAVRQLRNCGYLLVISGTGRTSSRYCLGPQFRVSREAYRYKPRGLPNQGANLGVSYQEKVTTEVVTYGRAVR